MKFSKLRLLGFKSFVDQSEFIIHDGLTGVVGPNGCGKSNLVEALRWVMGENSYKNMRASGMDDVIFAGSLNRPARNTAEVTLVLENSDRKAPAAFNDTDVLEITRRIERESGSIYRINSREARARDVQLLFADASTGARSPSLVGQGRIGEIISQKPIQRRAILEEAAGISGLHNRRHEAELRLKAAEVNLERLEDIMTQIETQLDGLKRQARQASRYRNLSAEIRKCEATVFYLRWAELTQQSAEAQQAFRLAEQDVVGSSACQASTAKDQAVAAHHLPELRQHEVEAAAVLQRLNLASAQLDQDEKRLSDRNTELDARLQQLSSDAKREEVQISENAGILGDLNKEYQNLVADKQAAADYLLTNSKIRIEKEHQLQILENEYSTATSAIANAEAEQRRSRLQLVETTARLEKLNNDVDRSSLVLVEISMQITRDSGLEDKQVAVSMALEKLQQAETSAVDAENRVSAARETETELRLVTNQAERESNRLETEARTLSKMLLGSGDKRFPPVVDKLTVSPGYEIALGAALGEDLDIPLGTESPAHWGLTSSQLTDPELPAGVEPLSSFVDGPVELGRRLKQIGIVKKSAIASIIDSLVCGQRLVSIEGDVWRWDGMRAAANAPTPAAKRLEQKNRLAEIEVKRVEIDQSALSLRKELNEKKLDVSSFASVDQLARETLRECQKQVAVARNLYATAERNVSEILARQTALEEQHTRLEQERSEATERHSSAVKEEGALKDISCLQNDLGDIRLRVVDLRRNVAETQALVRTLDREAQIRDNRLTAVEREQKNWKRRNIAASDQMKVLALRIEETRAERDTLVTDPDIFNQKRRELFKQISLSEDLRKQSADKLAKAELGVADSDRQAKSALEALSRSREARGRAEERSSAARDRCLDIEKRIREELELEPSATRKLAGLDNVNTVPDRVIVEAKLEKLKREREKLGGVNLRADDEAREISEKLDVMGTDRDDLVEAIKRLRTGIYNLNKEARERLLAAFEIVNGHFRDLFSTLFGGGQAELKLTEAEDPLDAGLDIIARPPGKKPQTMTLLSGGEQALTALSLIFAVFLTNPSPICVLDEVDAPLDDANVERYCSLLERMREQTETRFITITHNPITMSRMDRLYGVTMAERGVSQLVSVDLETATDFIEQDS